MKKRGKNNAIMSKKKVKKPLPFRLFIVFSIILILLLILYAYFTYLYNTNLNLIYLDKDFGLAQVRSLDENNPDVNLTQTGDIPLISITEGVYYPSLIDLDNYFIDLDGLNDTEFSYEFASGSNVELSFEKNSHSVSFNSSIGSNGNKSIRVILSYPGVNNSISNNFGVNVLPLACVDSDINSTYADGKNKFISGLTTNQIENMTDSCFSKDSVLEYFCYENGTIGKFITLCGDDRYCQNGRCIVNNSINHKPQFLDYKCSNLNLDTNKIRVIKLNECFEDDDGNILSFGVSGSDSIGIDMEIQGSDLTLIPHRDWVGTGFVNIWANDSMQEEIGKINLIVRAVSNTNFSSQNDNITVQANSDNLVIENASPSRNQVTIFSNEIINFSIGNKRYDSIIWYLDEKQLDNPNNFYILENPKEGNYTLKVIINKGENSTDKTWSVSVVNDKNLEFAFEVKNILFYIILIVVIVIIFLVFWLFVKEKTRGSQVKYQEEDDFKISIKDSKTEE